MPSARTAPVLLLDKRSGVGSGQDGMTSAAAQTVGRRARLDRHGGAGVRSEGHRVIVLGTTVVRAPGSAAAMGGVGAVWTDLVAS